MAKRAMAGYIGFRCTQETKQLLEDCADLMQVDPSDLLREIVHNSLKQRVNKLKVGKTNEENEGGAL